MQLTAGGDSHVDLARPRSNSPVINHFLWITSLTSRLLYKNLMFLLATVTKPFRLYLLTKLCELSFGPVTVLHTQKQAPHTCTHRHARTHTQPHAYITCHLTQCKITSCQRRAQVCKCGLKLEHVVTSKPPKHLGRYVIFFHVHFIPWHGQLTMYHELLTVR